MSPATYLISRLHPAYPGLIPAPGRTGARPGIDRRGRAPG